MLRREIRERKEYLYKKAEEEKKRTTEERKKKLKSALETNAPLPSELRKDALELQKTLDAETPGLNPLETHEDDEYRWAGVEDPSILITTSIQPGSKLREFVKELRLIFPNAQRVNRGSLGMKDLVSFCKLNIVTDLIIVHENRGVPKALEICHLPYGPTAYFSLCNVVTRHDIPDVGPMSEAYPHLIFHNFTSNLGKRLTNILKYLFPVPKEDSRRVITFYNESDFISFRQHTWRKSSDGSKNPELTEVGPRFEMRPYRIILGTADQKNVADTEWTLHSFTRTANKRKLLTNPEDDE